MENKFLGWSFNKFNKDKVLMAFEFAIVLSDVAKDLKIDMTRDIVLRAEELIVKEFGEHTAEHFACRMNVYALAVLEPKE